MNTVRKEEVTENHVAEPQPVSSLGAVRRVERFYSDNTRVITRLLIPGPRLRVLKILERLLQMPEEEVGPTLEETRERFRDRHRDLDRTFASHFDQIRRFAYESSVVTEEFTAEEQEIKDALWQPLEEVTPDRQLLIGAFFTLEYSVEAAAFMNPSIVPHPDQTNLAPGSQRFILTFRAVGEGHISSIVFRTGVIDSSHNIHFDPVSEFAQTPDVVANPSYDKHTFAMKLKEVSYQNYTTGIVLGTLRESFTLNELRQSIRDHMEEEGDDLDKETLRTIMWLALSNYELQFGNHHDITERVIFPVSRNEKNGIEDARFVKFTDDDGSVTWYATYTAYNGFTILPQMIETRDFLTFKILTLNGRAVQGKGMALFPRKINGRFMMIGRQDGENLFIMSSENLHFWHESQLLQEPVETWELLQLGNCGSPIETESGWIVLTHGVGPMRRYCLGAILLDREDPTRVIGRLRKPLLQPNEIEREGYVPNVVYTCGMLAHEGELIIPYAMSDTSSGIATVNIERLVQQLRADGAG